MTQNGIVTEIFDDGTANVQVRRSSMCDGCHKSEDGGCAICLSFGKKTQSVRALNEAGAVKGDVVRLEASSARVIFYAFCVFLLPLLVAVAFYALGKAIFGGSTAYAVLPVFCGLLITYVPLGIVLNKIAAKRPDVKITSLIHNKGDNEEA